MKKLKSPTQHANNDAPALNLGALHLAAFAGLGRSAALQSSRMLQRAGDAQIEHQQQQGGHHEEQNGRSHHQRFPRRLRLIERRSAPRRLLNRLVRRVPEVIDLPAVGKCKEFATVNLTDPFNLTLK
jgi:hypothetical protein